MLAEIFMVQLSTPPHASQENNAASETRFVPINLLKTSKTNPNVDAPAKALRTF